ncbi:hypothetical protein BC830DRAFT_1142474 [Chytriomyces sp. MP71]|nr:hypothetical protein BC830DRAFT_1142474 [Chytriomyces sp. MP71]
MLLFYIIIIITFLLLQSKALRTGRDGAAVGSMSRSRRPHQHRPRHFYCNLNFSFKGNSLPVSEGFVARNKLKAQEPIRFISSAALNNCHNSGHLWRLVYCLLASCSQTRFNPSCGSSWRSTMAARVAGSNYVPRPSCVNRSRCSAFARDEKNWNARV